MADMTMQELAGLTGYHPETLRLLARRGKLPGVYRVGRKWLIARQNVAKLRRLTVKGAAQ